MFYTYYVTIMSWLYVLFILLFFLLCHNSLYYVTIMSLLLLLFVLLFHIISNFCLYFQELVDAYSRPMHRAMTDKCPGAPAKLWGEQASSHFEAKPKYSAEKRLLYALFLVLYLLFRLSVQDFAAWNIDLRTVGQHAMILWDVSRHCIKKKAPLHVA